MATVRHKMAAPKAPKQFVRRLREALETNPDGLSLRQAAKLCGLSPSYLSLLSNGERAVPSTDAIASLERVLKITEGELFAAAQRPNEKALEFFRREEAGSIMRTLADVPEDRLPSLRKLIEEFVGGGKKGAGRKARP